MRAEYNKDGAHIERYLLVGNTATSWVAQFQCMLSDAVGESTERTGLQRVDTYLKMFYIIEWLGCDTVRSGFRPGFVWVQFLFN
jgi:hypothetical protein